MMHMVLAAAQADPVSHFDSQLLPRRVPPPSLARRKRPSDEDTTPEAVPPRSWPEDPDVVKYLFRFDPHARREGDAGSDEGAQVEPSGRRVERKDRKNKREQERRKEINDRFAILSDLLFGSKFSGRVDKTQILDRAIDLVRHGPSVLRNNDHLVMDSTSPDSEPRSLRENWPGDGLEKTRTPHNTAMRYRDNPREDMHPKYASNAFVQPPYPSFPSSNGQSGFAYPSTSFYHQYTPHPFPGRLAPEPCSHLPTRRGASGSRCDCESEENMNRERVIAREDSFNQLNPNETKCLGQSTGSCNSSNCCGNGPNSSNCCGNGANSSNCCGNGPNCTPRTDLSQHLHQQHRHHHQHQQQQQQPQQAHHQKDDERHVQHQSHRTRNGRLQQEHLQDTESDDDEDEEDEEGTGNDETKNTSNSSGTDGRFHARGNSHSKASSRKHSGPNSAPSLSSGRPKSGFDPLGQTDANMQVALVDTLVQLSQNAKRSKN